MVMPVQQPLEVWHARAAADPALCRYQGRACAGIGAGARARYHAVAFGEHRFLDSETGSVYRMDASFGLDVDSRPIRRMRAGMLRRARATISPALFESGTFSFNASRAAM